MLSRLFYRSLTVHLKTLTLISSSSSHFPILPTPPSLKPLFFSLRPFSSKGGDGDGDGDGSWNFFDESTTSIFGEECRTSTLAGIADEVSKGDDPWLDEKKGDVFEGIEKESLPRVGGGDGDDGEWETAEGYKPWSLGGGDDEGGGIGRDIFGFGEVGEVGRIEGIEGFGEGLLEGDGNLKTEEQIELERREQELLATLKGPNRAFGDLIAASGITEDMLDSLILLKDVRGIKGLPPLQEIEDKAIAKMNATSSRAEIERRKQEEIANARVRQVDEKGRAYGTGRRKCSIARVWIKPGDGKFVVNDKEFDSYFPALDHRAELLRPFTVTNTLGLWDIACTVKGGGVSGQVGAIRLGISRALQNWEPGLRPYLKSAGYLTRDSRVVERKKYGRAKARKSFQWVKR